MWIICLALAALLLLPTASLAQAATRTPRPAPTEKECRVCNEEIIAASTSTPAPQPAAHFWFFYDSGCDPCIRTLNEVLPSILAGYPPGQVEAHTWDMAHQGHEPRLALEEQYGRAAEEIPVVFIGDDMLAGDAEIQRDLAALIDKYLAQGGVALPQAPPTATPEAIAQPVNLTAAQPPSSGKVIIYFFWGDGCPHCADEKPLLERLKQQYPVEVRAYEVWYVPENQNILIKMTAAYGFEPSGVPTTFIGKRHWVGYSDRIGQEIESAVKECLASDCPDAGAGIITPVQPTPAASGTAAAPSATPVVITATPVSDPPASILDIPLLGAVNLASQSLLASTALIALVDGFNPCSLWVLSILLALTLHTGSRKKVLVIGLVFLTVTSLVYVLFIAGLFTLFTFISFLGWIQVVVALVALFFAAVNIKDYFWYKEGISFTIDDTQKPGIYKRMRNVLNAGDSLVALVSATVVMSAGVSLVEFACTAGFPVLWTNLLAAHQVEPLAFGLLLALYMVIYQIDELGIFLTAVFTLKSSKLEEKHGRILKLIGGMLMLTLAIVMVVKPALMNNLGNSLLIFGVAFGAAALVLVVHRYILPRWGIVIGTEELAASGKSASRKKRRK